MSEKLWQGCVCGQREVTESGTCHFQLPVSPVGPATCPQPSHLPELQGWGAECVTEAMGTGHTSTASLLTLCHQPGALGTALGWALTVHKGRRCCWHLSVWYHPFLQPMC